ncbi:MAG: hypothetical protein GY714_04895 [Desulfobacterales bacterium]|nr:hypothetical protein [Desulfobacterales bacterium]
MGDIANLNKAIEKREKKIEIEVVHNIRTERLKRHFGDNFDEEKFNKSIENAKTSILSKIKNIETQKKWKENALKVKGIGANAKAAIEGLDGTELKLNSSNMKRLNVAKGVAGFYGSVEFLLDIPENMEANDRDVLKSAVVMGLTELVSQAISFGIAGALQITTGTPMPVGLAIGSTVASAVKGSVEKYISHLYSRFTGEYASDKTYKEATDELYKELKTLSKKEPRHQKRISTINKELKQRNLFENKFENDYKKYYFPEETKGYIKEDLFQFYLIKKSSKEELLEHEKNLDPNVKVLGNYGYWGNNDKLIYEDISKYSGELDILLDKKSKISGNDPDKDKFDDQIEQTKRHLYALNNVKNTRENRYIDNVKNKLQGIESTDDRNKRIASNKKKLLKVRSKIEHYSKHHKKMMSEISDKKSARYKVHSKRYKHSEKQLKFVDDYIKGKATVDDSKQLIKNNKYGSLANLKLEYDGSEKEVSKLLIQKAAFRRYKAGKGNKYNPLDTRKTNVKDFQNPNIHNSFEEFMISETDKLDSKGVLKKQNNRIKKEKTYFTNLKKAEEISKHTFYRGSGKKQLSVNQLMHKPELIDDYYNEMKEEQKERLLKKDDLKKMDSSFLAYELERIHAEITTLLTHTQGHINDQKIHDYKAKFEGKKEKFKPIKIDNRTLMGSNK